MNTCTRAVGIERRIRISSLGGRENDSNIFGRLVDTGEGIFGKGELSYFRCFVYNVQIPQK